MYLNKPGTRGGGKASNGIQEHYVDRWASGYITDWLSLIKPVWYNACIEKGSDYWLCTDEMERWIMYIVSQTADTNLFELIKYSTQLVKYSTQLIKYSTQLIKYSTQLIE